MGDGCECVLVCRGDEWGVSIFGGGGEEGPGVGVGWGGDKGNVVIIFMPHEVSFAVMSQQ